MVEPVENRWRTLAFAREEAWVVHVALLARVRRAVEDGDADDSYPELEALEALEDGRERFSPHEVSVIRSALEAYLTAAPPRDVAPGRAALRRAGGLE